MNGKRMNSQTSKNQTKARPNLKTAESAEKIHAMKRLFKIKTHKMNFRSSRHIVSGSCEKVAWAVHPWKN